VGRHATARFTFRPRARGSRRNRTDPHGGKILMETTRMVHRSITAAFCTLLAAASAKAAVVTLHPLPALSTVPSHATGIADVDSVQGVVTLEVHDLPPLPAGAVYAGLLVHNTPGPGHLIGLDPVPDGDVVLDLGSLAQRGRLRV